MPCPTMQRGVLHSTYCTESMPPVAPYISIESRWGQAPENELDPWEEPETALYEDQRTAKISELRIRHIEPAGVPSVHKTPANIHPQCSVRYAALVPPHDPISAIATSNSRWTEISVYRRVLLAPLRTMSMSQFSKDSVGWIRAGGSGM